MTKWLSKKQSLITDSVIVRTFVLLALCWLVYATFDILMLVAVAIFLAASITPLVDRLENRYIPRALTMIVIYILVMCMIVLLAITIFPSVLNQATSMISEFPSTYTHFLKWLTNGDLNSNTSGSYTEISNNISKITEGALFTVFTILESLFSFFIVLVLTFYLVVDKASAKRTVNALPTIYQERIVSLYNKISKQIGRWLRAQILLMILVGVLTYVALTLINHFAVNWFYLPRFEYALTLSLVAGVLEFIPYLGPILSAIPAIVLAFGIHPQLALAVAVAYWLIQMIEGNILTPKIMQRAVGLSPIVSIVAFLIGARLAGFSGAFLAIPLTTAVMIIVKDLWQNRPTST